MITHRLAGRPRWLAVLLVLTLFAGVLTPAGASAQSSATTTAPLNMRTGPGTEHPIITVIPSGAGVSVTGGSQAGFLPVTWNGNNGWASADYLSTGGEAAPAPTSTGSGTTTAPLNFRNGPGTGYGIIGVIPSGGTVSLTGESSGGFLSIVYNGTAGWVSGNYISTGTSAPAPAPEPAPAPSTGTASATAPLNVRSGPGTSYPALTVIPAGASVSLTGENANGFLSVSYNGIAGWSSADYLNTGSGTPAPSNPAPQPVSSLVTTANLNLRSNASLTSSVLTVIPAGTTVSITGSAQNGFLPVAYGGVTGWASADFLADPASAPQPAPNPGGGSGLIWPVSGGTWTIIQGYNGGTHQNRSGSAQYYYALDIARVDGNTAGQPVYAPASGTIQWLDPASGGIAINMGNGYVVAMFHATFDSGLSRGQTVSQGQYLGTVSGPGGAGYASTPHIDITLWQSSDGRSRSAAPFTGGNSISGMSLGDTGGWNQHAGTQFTP